jgi:type I restriction enzyme S subunit
MPRRATSPGDLASLGTGSTFRELSREKLSGFKLLVPPVETQRAIADFLDRETAKIDALIAKQEELIAQIEEKRAATITQAVTKGLNPTVAMRPSGFEWIGDIPEHWLVRPLKRQASRIVVGIAEAATHAYADAGVPIIRSTNVFPNRIETHNLLFLQAQFAGDRASKMIRAGDLLTARTGNAGVTAVVPDDLDGSQCFTMLITSLRNGYIPKYFCYFINSKAGTTFYDLESWGTAQRNISVPILGDTPVCVPPTCEQEAIADFVSGQERNFEALRAAAVRHCDLLVEHRSALITAAVTGQIDVRATPTQPIAIAANDNRQALRAVVGAEIVSRQGSAKNFGRVKLQKLIYLAEVHAGIHELAGNYVRQAAGPLAPDLLSETERGMEAGGFYRTVPPTNEGDGYIYSRIGKAGAHGDQFAAMLGDRAATLTQLIDRFKDYDTRQVEAITTLYAVWNDALIDGETPTDDRIIRGVLEEWHPEKKDKFTATDLKPWLAWMRRNGVVPTGTGSRTQLDRLFV